MKPTCVVLFSGGLDSAVMAHDLIKQGERVLGLSAKYGSQHNPHERKAAETLRTHFRTQYGLDSFDLFRADLEQAFVHAGGPMFLGDLPVGHFEDDSMKATVVPGRNLVLIAVAASLAQSRGANRVYVGAHKGDHAIYPDCRPEFLGAAATAVEKGSDGRVLLFAPFTIYDKRAVVELGARNKFPFELTRTCYSDKAVACGKCGSCQERLSAFFAAGIEDPLVYESRSLLGKTVGSPN